MRIVVLSILIAFTAATAANGQTTTNFMGGTPSARELVEALRTDHPLGRKRGLQKARSVQIETSDCALVTRGLKGAAAKAVILDIKFEFDSDQLTSNAQETLDQLGIALNQPELAADRFVVEGHTDAVGTMAYNRELSKRRAQTVRSYLCVWHGIDADRLAISCKGETELLDPDNPTSGVNRRVHVINTG